MPNQARNGLRAQWPVVVSDVRKSVARRRAEGIVSSPTARTLAKLREEGWTAQVVERFNPYSKTRVDLGGGIDIVAWSSLGPETLSGIMGVQACAGASHAARRDKLLALPSMREWVAAGARLEIWSWAKQGARGARKLWTLRREALELAMFMPNQAASLKGETAQQQTREALT
jgi:hypothetical protein